MNKLLSFVLILFGAATGIGVYHCCCDQKPAPLFPTVPAPVLPDGKPWKPFGTEAKPVLFVHDQLGAPLDANKAFLDFLRILTEGIADFRDLAKILKEWNAELRLRLAEDGGSAAWWGKAGAGGMMGSMIANALALLLVASKMQTKPPDKAG